MQIKGVIFDIGGVLYVGDSVIDGAIEAIKKIKSKYKVRFLTNTTRRAPKSVLKRLNSFGFEVSEDELFTALNATRDYIIKNRGSAYLILTNEAKEYFKDLESNNPSYVVVGDAYTNFNYENLNRGFRALMNGAKLIAAAKNRYFKDSDNQLSLDAGGFVEALEFASNQKAKIIGKPSKEFFNLALSSLNLEPKEVLMVGDDIQNDILGAKEAGLNTALVKTGKFQESDLKKDIKPDFILDSVVDLLDIIF